MRTIWVLLPNFHTEGLGEPIAAFETEEAAARMVALFDRLPAPQSVKLCQVEIVTISASDGPRVLTVIPKADVPGIIPEAAPREGGIDPAAFPDCPNAALLNQAVGIVFRSANAKKSFDRYGLTNSIAQMIRAEYGNLTLKSEMPGLTG